MRPRPWPRFVDYLIAVAATAVALLLRAAFDPWVGADYPLGFLLGAVGVAMWFGGIRAAVLSVVIGYLAAFWFFIEPRGSFVFPPQEIGRLLMYLFSCAVLIGFWQAVRLSNRRLEAANAIAEWSMERQRVVEQSLRRSEAQLQLVTDSMSAPVTRCSRDFRYLWVSAPYARWLKRKPEDIIGQPIESIIGHQAFHTLMPYFERVLAGEEVRYEEQVDFHGLGPRWIHAVYSPTFDDQGVADGWVAVVLDIDDRRRVEEALKDANRRKDEFLATLAHELRNPLAPIRNATQILRLEKAAPHEIAWARDVIDRQMHHMTRLIDDLLDVSRITRNRIELRRERVSLSRIIQGAVETSRPMIDASGHKLTFALPSEPIELDADLTRLAQVFSNLLNNAAKFTERGGLIHLTARREGSDVVVSVKDSGVGIPADMLSSVFELFTQVDRSLERSRTGLGIGLTMVKRLVEMHGGSVTALSEGTGHGSEFIVRLPIVVPAIPSHAAVASEERPASVPAGRRVLVVDDNADSATSLAMMLGATGYEVRTAYDGTTGFAATEEFRPDVALLDIGMPGMNGYDLARRIREQSWGKEMVLIAVTGWGQAEDRERTIAAGFDEHLVKPVDPTVLLTRLQSRFERGGVLR